MQYHPDKNPDNEFTAARFLDIQEAYTTLSDNRRRADYDDDRWFAGLDRRRQYEEPITPAWLLDMSKKLNKSLKEMDTHRISHGALAQYILLLLSDAHLGVLLRHNEEQINTDIINEIIAATRVLEAKYLDAIIPRLNTIAAKGASAQNISAYADAREKDAFRQRIFPYMVLLITLALCVFMYFYGSR